MDDPDRVWRERGLREAVLSGDERAWRRLYEEGHSRLYTYALWRCGGLRDQADEVTQEVWLVALRRLESFDPDAGSFVGWLRGIAGGVLRNRFRLEQRRRQAPVPIPAGLPETIDAEILRREKAVGVARALASLPEHYEAVLRLRYLEECPVADIARLRGESFKATESLLSRAREAFRQAYTPED